MRALEGASMEYLQNEDVYGKNRYSFFTNEYILTKEICAEAERSRVDILIEYGVAVATAVLLVFFMSIPENFPGIADRIYGYFSSPSAGTILELSGVGITVFGFPAAVIVGFGMLIRFFPHMVGEKRLEEQLKFVPSANRRVDFYDQYVEVKGKFSKKLPYAELKRTGETRNLYLLFFTERRMLILHKSGFRKGRLPDVKSFIAKRRTVKSKVFGVVRHLPVIYVSVVFLVAFWQDMQ